MVNLVDHIQLIKFRFHTSWLRYGRSGLYAASKNNSMAVVAWLPGLLRLRPRMGYSHTLARGIRWISPPRRQAWGRLEGCSIVEAWELPQAGLRAGKFIGAQGLRYENCILIPLAKNSPSGFSPSHQIQKISESLHSGRSGGGITKRSERHVYEQGAPFTTHEIGHAERWLARVAGGGGGDDFLCCAVISKEGGKEGAPSGREMGDSYTLSQGRLDFLSPAGRLDATRGLW